VSVLTTGDIERAKKGVATDLVGRLVSPEAVDDVFDLLHIRRGFQHVLDLGREGRVDQICQTRNRDVSIYWSTPLVSLLIGGACMGGTYQTRR